MNALAHHVLNKDLGDIVGDFRGFYRQLTSDGQLRWVRDLIFKMFLQVILLRSKMCFDCNKCENRQAYNFKVKHY